MVKLRKPLYLEKTAGYSDVGEKERDRAQKCQELLYIEKIAEYSKVGR